MIWGRRVVLKFWLPQGPINENKKKKIVKNQKLKISKIQNSIFVRTSEKKIQKKFERIQKRFEGAVGG